MAAEIPQDWRALSVALADLPLTEPDRRLLQSLIDGPQAGDASPPSLPSYALRKALAPVSREVAARLLFWAERAEAAKAEALLSVAVAVAPDDAPARVALAWRQFDRGAREEACRTAARAYETAPELAAAAYGFLLLETGDLSAAERVLRAGLAATPTHAPLYWYAGLIAHRRGDLPGAATALRAACALDPKLPDAALALAWVLHDLGDLSEAEVWSAHALAHGVTGDRLLQAAWFAFCRRDYSVAEASYRAAADLIPLADPRSILLYQHWAEALQAGGRGEDARRHLAKALHVHSDAARLWYRLGCIAQEAGDWQAADAALANAHRLEPTLADAFFRRAQVLHGRGMAEGVAWLLEQTLYLAPATVGALGLLAETLRELGKDEAAQAYRPEPLPLAAAPETALTGKARLRAEAARDFDTWRRSGQPLRLPICPPSQVPDISVVIVAFNQVGFSLQALTALTAQTGPCFETILVDNASTDGTPDLLARVQGATILRNGENFGFLRAANQGAARARGRHILFLNSDAQVQPGALAAALARMEGDASIGAVGGQIILTDGRLQEAGNILYRDGAALGYGRGADPDAADYGFVRDVDYCSGAFLLVRRALWKMLGGFDPVFVPAYYEDADFCLRIWRAGFRVVYEPRARVIHVEAGSAESFDAAIAQMEANRHAFVLRHPDLRHRRPATEARPVIDRWRPSPYPRVLLIDLAGKKLARTRIILNACADFPITLLGGDGLDSPLPPTVEVIAGMDAVSFLRARQGVYQVLLARGDGARRIVEDLRRHHPEYLADLTLIYDCDAGDLPEAGAGVRLLVAAEPLAVAAQQAGCRDVRFLPDSAEDFAWHYRHALTDPSAA